MRAVLCFGFFAVFMARVVFGGEVVVEPNIFAIDPNFETDPNTILAEPYSGRKIVEGAKAWAVACAGVLEEYNYNPHDSLEDCSLNDASGVGSSRRGMSEWWGIKDRETFLEIIEWLEDGGGHREKFAELGDELAQMDFLEYAEYLRDCDSVAEAQEAIVAFEWYPKLGEKGILGWDLSRAIYLCRSAYTCGYITEEEAWTRIMAYARMLQATFNSWEELGQNYLIGRRYWSYNETQKSGKTIEAAYRRMTESVNSPWRKLEWKMDLGAVK